ncbi:T9SS type A sorting domain-containing protein [candidate division KSB1 bacterium]|nr:T9SS type A sorting domain-containing protein [candidate division KSB1 bacterium]
MRFCLFFILLISVFTAYADITIPVAYTPVTKIDMDQILTVDGAGSFTSDFSQPYIYKFSMTSFNNDAAATKIIFKFEQTPEKVIGASDGDHQKPVYCGKDDVNWYEFDEVSGWTDITSYCIGNNIYAFVMEHAFTHMSSYLNLWLGFQSTLGPFLDYEIVTNYNGPATFDVQAYRIIKNLPSQLQIVNPLSYKPAYIQPNDKYYIDRDFYVIDIPEQLQNCLWIRTANEDKTNQNDSFLTFHLDSLAEIYVAYDNRAISVPDWLSSNFQQTGLTIEVSDQSSPMNVWSKNAEPGIYTLGGNMADPAAGANSNYVVLLDFENSNPPDAVNDKISKIHAEFQLRQNYPNPFNPQTEITFGLPKTAHVTITVYNLKGDLIETLFSGKKAAGFHHITWNALNHSSGTFFIKMKAENFVIVNKCVLLK